MGIWESLQGLPFEAKAAIAIPTIVAGVFLAISEFRHETRHRADQERIARYDAADLREKRALLDLEPARGQTRGAAMILGSVDHDGAATGQHFTGVLKNEGPHLAEGIRVTADLGGIEAQIINAPKILHPREVAPIDVMVPMETFTYADIIGMIRADQPLRIRIDYVDGTSAPAPIFRCFVFRLIDDEGPADSKGKKGKHWVSSLEPCPPAET